jgi:hypothetical protein
MENRRGCGRRPILERKPGITMDDCETLRNSLFSAADMRARIEKNTSQI